ncbi:hypothetical protein M427DRAFT_163586 [Gonapodya prolifera JEL478]|uniref:DNA polymerase n=1 Tax=Gonapodya prolifera (strain JEL478) TaxID=1344416 RepID=A0A139B040_GONPJ|nr:hypothetical protein M427DRAFT_163586 [Gonapodya prolifera JEL478]|eukprot:KXS22075.1 hypothetical protein M427DRAFT_163586 [Gonapodya prolifera JEL478]
MSRRRDADEGSGLSAIRKLKEAKKKGISRLEELKFDDDESIFEQVSEEDYDQIVRNRLKEDDFVVDDDGRGYVDNGEEVWERHHEYADNGSSEEAEEDNGRAGKRKRKKESKVKPEARITTMFSKMTSKPGAAKPASAPKPAKPDSRADEDLLASVLGNLDSVVEEPAPKRPKLPTTASTGSAVRGAPTSASSSTVRELERIAVFGKASDARSAATEIAIKDFNNDNFSTVAPNGDLEFNWDDSNDVKPMEISDPLCSAEAEASSSPQAPATAAAPALKVRAIQTRPTTSKAESSSLLPTFAPLVEPSGNPTAATVVSAPENSRAAGWQTVVANMSGSGEPENVSSPATTGGVPMLEAGGSLRMYWLDAHERAGIVYLFGKVKDKSGRFLSCCVTVNGMERNLIVVPRPYKLDESGHPTDVPVEFLDVYNEFNELRTKYKIGEWRCKPAMRKYAFEVEGVPQEESEHLKVKYSFQQPEMKDVPPGKTFSHVFGTGTSAMELFLLKRKVMGPCWLEIKEPQFSSKSISWCKFEVVVSDPKQINAVPENEQPPSPPLTVMVINTKTVMNQQKRTNEIVAISALVYGAMSIEDASSRAEQSHFRFTVIRQYNDFPVPAGFQELVAASKEKVEVCRNERGLLNFFIAQIGRHDPDVLVGHNFIGFDLDVLLHRMKTHKVDHWSRLGRLRRTVWPKLQSGAGGTGDATFAERQVASGRLIVDTYLAAKEHVRSKSYSLTQLSLSQLNIAREEIDFERIPAYFSGSARDLMLFVRLSQTDVYLVAKLMFKIQILPLSKQLTNLAGNLWSRTLMGGRAERNEFLLLHEFHKLKYILPDKSFANSKKNKQGAATAPELDGDDEGDDEKPQDERRRGTTGRRKPAYSGGLVLEPKKGFYDMFVLLLDFNSLYPSIIQEYNIDFTTIQRSYGDESEETLPELPDPQAQTGVLPKILKTLVDRRRQVKSLMKSAQGADYSSLDIRQKALKLTANSMYGCLGFSHSRFYAKPLAMLITAKGREILQNTVDLATQQKLEVIYGDTDSIFLNTNTDDIKEVRRMGAEFKKVVNQRYRLLEIEMDALFRRMLLLKKKKYAALVVDEKDGKLEMTMETKGLDMVRRDWCGLSHDVSNFVLEKILSSDEGGREEIVDKIHKYLEQVGKETRAGLIPIDKFVINKQLTKNVEDYNDAKSQPHVQVALRLKAANKTVRVGDTVPYVIALKTDSGSDAYGSKKEDSFAARAYHPDDFKKDGSTLKVDVEWYLSNQVHPPIARLIAPIEGSDTGRIADCLGLDASKFRSNPAGVQAEMGSEVHTLDSLITDEERFKNVDKWCPRCRHCGQQNEFEIIRRKRAELPAIGLQCPNPECKQMMQLPSLLAQLMDAIRTHIARYELFWHCCDDLGCRCETRQVSVYGRRCLMLGCRGQMNLTYTDAMLFTQLSYYESLFDVDRLRQKMENQPSGGGWLDAAVAVASQYEAQLSKLREQVHRYLSKNARQFVDLSSLFKMMNLGGQKRQVAPIM